jgi:2-polyprenyl-3-methyl-5-hydroxy-6-metoxy-1,4-benzoquinol methylase
MGLHPKNYQVMLLLIMATVLTGQAQDHPAHNRANHHMNQMDFDALTQRFESARRDAYQQPGKVLSYIGDVSGETIMDIGSGTGYFSFRLVDAGARVIAADVDDRFQNYIRIKRDSLGIPESKLSLRKIPYDNPMLEKGEADRVIIVNTYHHIENRPDYFSKVKAGLKAGGSLIVIDYFKKQIPVGPPSGMKLPLETVVQELEEAGFTDIETNDSLLEYQYIVIAR